MRINQTREKIILIITTSCGHGFCWTRTTIFCSLHNIHVLYALYNRTHNRTHTRQTQYEHVEHKMHILYKTSTEKHARTHTHKHTHTILFVDELLGTIFYERLLKWFRVYKSNKTVPCHEKIDGVLSTREGIVVWLFHVFLYILRCLVVEIYLCVGGGGRAEFVKKLHTEEHMPPSYQKN